MKPLANQAAHFEQSCRSEPSPNDLSPAEADARTAACEQVLAAGPLFRSKYYATAAGLEHLEQVYSQEHRVDEELLQAAYRLQ